jgi:uncharacterized protein
MSQDITIDDALVDDALAAAWSEADSEAFQAAWMHDALMQGPMPEMAEGFITGTAVSPFDGTAEPMLASFLSFFEIDLDTLPEDAKQPLIDICQKRLNALLEELDPGTADDGAVKDADRVPFMSPLLSDWVTANVEDMPPPLDAELWARGICLAHAVWGEDHWMRLGKHNYKLIDKLHAPMMALSRNAAPVTDARQRNRLLDQALVSLNDLFGLTHSYYDRLAVTPAPIIRAAVPGRNDPCSCGSGKKYKKCCGA